MRVNGRDVGDYERIYMCKSGMAIETSKYGTVIPISSQESRKQFGSRVMIECSVYQMNVTDDLGGVTIIHSDDPNVILNAIRAAQAVDIPVTSCFSICV